MPVLRPCLSQEHAAVVAHIMTGGWQAAAKERHSLIPCTTTAAVCVTLPLAAASRRRSKSKLCTTYSTGCRILPTLSCRVVLVHYRILTRGAARSNPPPLFIGKEEAAGGEVYRRCVLMSALWVSLKSDSWRAIVKSGFRFTCRSTWLRDPQRRASMRSAAQKR